MVAEKKRAGAVKAPAPPAPPPPPSSGDDLAVVVRAESDMPPSVPTSPFLDVEEAIQDLDAEPDPFPATHRPSSSLAQTTAYLKKHGIDFHDNEDGTFSAITVKGSLKGGALVTLKYAFECVPHPHGKDAKAWTEAEIEAAVLAG